MVGSAFWLYPDLVARIFKIDAIGAKRVAREISSGRPIFPRGICDSNTG